MMEKSEEGSLVLGGRGSSLCTYVTRNRVLHYKRKLDPCTDSCCTYPGVRNGGAQLTRAEHCWECVRSEGCLFLLHLVVVALAGVDACLDLRHSTPEAHLIVCTLAAVTATIQMALRLTALRTSEIRTIVAEQQDRPSPSRTDVVGSTATKLAGMKRIYTGVCFAAIVGNAVLFTLCYLFFHLGWTVTSNNFFILGVGVVHRAVSDSVTRQMASDNADALRVVVYEATLLLREVIVALPSERRENYGNAMAVPVDRGLRFLAALRSTPCLERPMHIRLSPDVAARPPEVDRIVKKITKPTGSDRKTGEEHLSCV